MNDIMIKHFVKSLLSVLCCSIDCNCVCTLTTCLGTFRLFLCNHNMLISTLSLVRSSLMYMHLLFRLVIIIITRDVEN